MDLDPVRELLELERAREARRRRRNRTLAWALPGVLVVGLAWWGVAAKHGEDHRQR
ncbi:hypothetical protein [Isoptericola sp. NPDC057391]|uniref:hypothetical protein n=1 Tax=Isoptericola sp. NPDC057391 TaxID=3346117 RepID=UPI003645AD0B